MSKKILITRSQYERFKQSAKKLKKQNNALSLDDALQIVAKQNKFGNWKAVTNAYKLNHKLSIPTPDVSMNFVHDEDIVLSEEEEQNTSRERQQDLDDNLKLKIINNKKELAQHAIEFSMFEPTVTGLKKSILDATQPVRTLFELEKFHFYEQQKQGSDEYGVKRSAYFLTPAQLIESKVSLYRPKTKRGDPRMWFTGLGTFAPAGSQVAIIIFKDSLYLLNLSEINLEVELQHTSTIKTFIDEYLYENNSIADELLNKLRKLAKQPIRATHTGDTAIGMSIENALGIAANSSKLPDYKGIELKSGRGSSKNRATLFAQVAQWNISPYKKSADILDKFGYFREKDFKLYCSVSSQKPNSQGLIFKMDNDELQEWSTQVDDGKLKYKEHIASWSGALLRERLKEKHAETFWIEASSTTFDGIEYFQLLSVSYTKTPLLNQLMPLIESGVITMDHLIKRSGESNRVSEKGPLFKIDKRNFELLFPEPIKYELF
ncbi:MvaI/BcnI family restriction endonuclease [Yersinia mollaretii]|uniref:MvaI/BcnI restriction endonuclease domain-containing protein n=1 Tax=Yersinia mollaretii TaxID=33060 RepID=A0AA36PLL1_YERMO|nr:MvaI/BcnI family restriction endonuclease [Yersinia mollaretii]MDA5525244.1 MvaI/BcnI family restriction endonuclease [Yersinia mollaretii]MDR7872635.1 MvaI/BcnI family restriction endonuclease [Yersinia mollaretii]PHZ33361.1 hypothetical protein CS537_00750 [Yersinia mollaretii]WQC75776.1 MvaI/BcnI family restriction endonuclease [Yersinia mollaretii]CNE39718.1 Uncharacterised protein [Yersinia mollaretii]